MMNDILNYNFMYMQFRTSPSKWISLKGWIAVKLEDVTQMDIFTLSDPSGRNVYKFKCETTKEAFEWCKHINGVSLLLSHDRSIAECLIQFEEQDKSATTL